MGLSKELLLALDDAQYVTPSRIQQAFIPEALTGNDVMGQAQTGTGKTAAFTIPILQMIEFDEDSFDPQALILVPTRELAVQVKDEIEKLAKYSDLECVALYGGKPLAPQVQQLRAGVDIVVGTPGRIMDHIKRGALKLRNLKISILDEADRMLDIGFRPDIEKILRMAPQSRQSLLLSATIPPSVESIARKYMREPKLVDCSQKDISSETIEQFYFTVDPELKFDLLLKLLEREKPQQAIIFCRTKRGVERIANRLTKEISSVESIHGDLQQRKRDRVMASFRSGKTRFLVATDVVGRGIDVSGISHIINYDIPKFCDDYVHRVGRTGRMGHEGVAFTFVAPEEGNELTRIEMRINQLLKRDEIPGFSGLPTMTAVPPLEIAQDEEEKKLPRRRRRL
ncbi:MAG: DEAD/DEAH box helicase [Planctomycetaceae bacterium]|nr:DEAD/DEAH box helicase [Planctomycetaceae bacterium]